MRGLPPAALLGGYVLAVYRLSGLGPIGSTTQVLLGALAVAVAVWLPFGMLIARQDARVRAAAPPVAAATWQQRADVAWRGEQALDPDVRAWARWLLEQDLARMRSVWDGPLLWGVVTLGLPVVMGVLAVVVSVLTGTGIGVLFLPAVVLGMGTYTRERRLRRRAAQLGR